MEISELQRTLLKQAGYTDEEINKALPVAEALGKDPVLYIKQFVTPETKKKDTKKQKDNKGSGLVVKTGSERVKLSTSMFDLVTFTSITDKPYWAIAFNDPNVQSTYKTTYGKPMSFISYEVYNLLYVFLKDMQNSMDICRSDLSHEKEKSEMYKSVVETLKKNGVIK